ncbi:Uncharacterized protein Fot_39024 [Forsythia ovata]|uniref:Uncharacterized protein n=1 Tax=Forsythia ovata TaxID=205694 RepID=A0ABD1S3G3_9LAMI
MDDAFATISQFYKPNFNVSRYIERSLYELLDFYSEKLMKDSETINDSDDLDIGTNPTEEAFKMEPALLASDTAVESSAEAPSCFLESLTKEGVLFTIYGLFSPDMCSQFTSPVFDGRRFVKGESQK